MLGFNLIHVSKWGTRSSGENSLCGFSLFGRRKNELWRLPLNTKCAVLEQYVLTSLGFNSLSCYTAKRIIRSIYSLTHFEIFIIWKEYHLYRIFISRCHLNILAYQVVFQPVDIIRHFTTNKNIYVQTCVAYMHTHRLCWFLSSVCRAINMSFRIGQRQVGVFAKDVFYRNKFVVLP